MKIKSFIFLLFGFFILNTCSTQNDNNVIEVARVGSKIITFEELDKSFILNPQYAIRTPLSKARESQLKFLINEKYYYLTAIEVDLTQDPLIQKRISYIKNQETIKAYLKQNFMRRVDIPKIELLQAFSKFGKKVKVQNLYAPTLEDAKTIKARLTSGESFIQIAKKIYKNESLRESGGDIGYVTFGDLEPDVEDRVFSMQIGEISDPVKSIYGYHILRATDIQQHEQNLNLDSATKIKLITEILRNRQTDRLIRAQLRVLANNQKIQVNNRVLDILVNATREVMKDRYNEQNLLKPPIFTKDLISIRMSVKDIGHEVLARFGDSEMKVEEFLNRLKEMPPYHRPYLGTRNRMIQSMIDIIRFDLILKKAKEEGVNRQQDVRNSCSKYIEELLVDEFKKRIFSEEFREISSQRWKTYKNTIDHIRKNEPPKINTTNLFRDVSNPDSIMAPAPIHVFLKDKYVW